MKVNFSGARLITIALFLGSLALSIASAVTTFLGMQDYSGFLVVAVGVTFGVQSLLFVISWWIGQNWRRGWQYILGGALVFIICAAVSVFFSFASLYKTIDNGRSDTAAFLRMKNLVSELDIKLNEKLEKLISEENMVFISSTQAVSWVSNIEDVIASASGASVELTQVSEAKKAELQKKLGDLKLSLAKIESEIKDLERQETRADENANARYVAYTKARNIRIDLEEKIKALAAVIEGDTLRRDREAARGSCGRKCKIIEAEIQPKKDSLEALEVQLKLAIQNEEVNKSDYDSLSESTRSSAQIQELRRQEAQLQTQIEKVKTGLGVEDHQLGEGISGLTSTLRAQVEKFGNLSFENIEETVRTCNQLLDGLLSASVVPTNTDLSCSSADLMSGLNRVNALTDLKENLKSVCDSKDATKNASDFEFLMGYGEQCINSAGIVDEEIKTMQEALFSIYQSRSKDAHPIAKVQAAFFVDHDPLAIFALGLALSIDLLVLLCALIGSNVGTSELSRAIQYVLLYRYDDPDSPSMQLILEPKNSQEKILFDKASEWLSSKGKGSFIRDTEGERKVFRFSDTALEMMQKTLRTESNPDPSVSHNLDHGDENKRQKVGIRKIKN